MSQNDEEKAVRNFIIIFVVVILIAVGIYFFTKLVVNKDEGKKEEETAAVEIDNTKAIVGTMLGKVENNYYVILYKSSDSNASEYSALKTSYEKNKDKLPVYTVDLSNKLNEQYYDKDNTNYTSDNINDLSKR